MIETLNTLCTQSMRKPIRPDDDLIGKGLNANRALKIIKGFWLATGVELDVNIFYVYRSVGTIVAAIEAGEPMTTDKVVTLRNGDPSRPLFLYAGGVNCFLEMRDMIAALRFDGVICGITLTDFCRPETDPPSVADEIDRAISALKAAQPAGPYRLCGYSFGGVYALELARRIRANGDEVEFLAIIDPPQNDHSWPFSDWAALMVGTARRKLRSLVAARAARQATGREDTSPALFEHSPPRRGHQITFRFRNPRHPDYPLHAPQWAGNYPPRYSRGARQLLQMKGLFRPAPYAGRLLFIASAAGSPVDCDSRRIWTPYLAKAHWIPVAGNHLSMMVGRNAHAIAASIDEHLHVDLDAWEVEHGALPTDAAEAVA